MFLGPLFVALVLIPNSPHCSKWVLLERQEDG